MHEGPESSLNSPTDGASAGTTDGGSAETERSEPATVHVIVGSARARIVLSGEIDADLAGDLQEASAHAEATSLPVEIDAHHVTFMDSSGVAFLARLASRSPHRVRILRAPPTVRFLLEVTRIGELLDIADDDPGFEVSGSVSTLRPNRS
ncbi:hypothetical protein GCM10025865_08900 [Paraoerskovia sediminicola]|uniref:STAS domain-containing protein n=1 Tax=Paraoerskovia sediminicola TaxID=1138587 RepID=A0ABM8G0L2_9CELL|nr:hypothetical protein GCM10025865_08900 [Paraoerskovia sediminicola]